MDILGKFLDLFSSAIGELEPGDKRGLFEAVHRAIVVLDDYLCERFGFSRRGRGKHAIDK